MRRDKPPLPPARPSVEDLIQRAVSAPTPEMALSHLRRAGAMIGGETSVLAARIEGLIGYFLHRSGNLEEARSKFEASERLWDRLPAGQSPERRAAMLCNCANLLCDLGFYGAARRRMEAALTIERRMVGADQLEYGRTLANYARLLGEIGLTEDALRHARAAVVLLDRCDTSRGQLDARFARNILGIILMHAGAWTDAHELFTSLWEQVKDETDFDIGYSVANNVGWALYGIGDYDGAASWYQRALALLKGRPGGAPEVEATLLTNIGSTRHRREDFEGACSFYDRARAALERAVPDGRHPQMASIQNNWGMALYRLGRGKEARRQFEQALELRRAINGDDHKATADVRFHLAELTLDDGAASDAIDQAIAVLASPGVHDAPDTLWRLFNVIARALGAQGRHSLAILFAKQAVEIIETMRLSVIALGREAEVLFTSSRAVAYRSLVDLLLFESRLAEVDVVLRRLRGAEHDALFGRDAGTETTNRPTFSRLEEAWRAPMAAQLARIAASQVSLDREAQADADADADAMALMRRDIAEAAARLSAAVAELIRDTRDAQLKMARAEVSDPGKEGPCLRPGEIFLHVFPADSAFWALRRDHRGTVERRRIDVDADTLNGSVMDLRSELSTPCSSIEAVKKKSLQLYDMAFRRLLDDVPDGGADLLFWLDGSLRFLPPAALFDGKRYLVERASIAMYSPFAVAETRRRRLVCDGIAGFAAGRTIPGFAPLPFAVKEIEAVVGEHPGEGLFHGERFIDERFTSDNVKRAVGRFGGLLVASHFVLQPADLRRSGLLLGTGELWPVLEIAELYFGGIELVTLSSCDTGTAGLDADEVVLQSFADRLLRRGAGSVLASLWRVADEASARLVTDLYTRLVQGHGLIPRALAESQLAMLRGEGPVAWRAAAARGIGQGDGTAGALDGRHPYYWSPFVVVSGGPEA